MNRKQIEALRKRLKDLGYTNIRIRRGSRDDITYRVVAKWNGSYRMSSGYFFPEEIFGSMLELAQK